MRMGSYDNWNYSPLDRINKGNVANLKVKFMAAISDPSRPSKGNQYLCRWSMMVSCTSATSISNTEVRRPRREAEEGVEVRCQSAGRRPEPAQRRTARQQPLSQHRPRQPNPRLVALDKNSGRGGVRRRTSDPAVAGSGHSSAPLAVKDKYLVGHDRGAARAAGATSRLMRPTPASCCGGFRWFPSRAAGARRPGPTRRTIPTGGGGGGPSRPTIPRPTSPIRDLQSCAHVRPAGAPRRQSLTSSIIALDVDTGKLKWYFQTIANEGWDYDAVAITQLYDINIGGETRKVISQTNRNGFRCTSSTAPTGSSFAASPLPR